MHSIGQIFTSTLYMTIPVLIHISAKAKLLALSFVLILEKAR